jgi:predicted acylesterase/phospholipase RssA
MLTLHQARTPKPEQSPAKTGLAIAGGGPVGAIYELGALRAIDESIHGLKLHELDVYVGVSSGALIAACLANGISTAEICRIFMGQEHAKLRFDPQRLMRPAYREYFERISNLPGIVSDTLINFIRHPTHTTVSELVKDLGRVVPSGIFNNETLNRFLEEAFSIMGRGNRFSDLDCELYVVAVDLDSGTAVRFGSEGHRDVTISRAVQASAALPGLYPPVEINGQFYVDGALRRTLNASAALDKDVDILLAVNPLVPYDSGAKGQNPQVSDRRLNSGGLPLILSQTFRAMIQSRMEAGFKKYFNSHPSADLLLLEPDRDDEEIFFTNIFSYSSRKTLCEHAYQSTRRQLRSRQQDLTTILARHGMSLRLDILNDTQRNLEQSMGEGQSSHAATARNLSGTLNQLEEWLEERKIG